MKKRKGNKRKGKGCKKKAGKLKGRKFFSNEHKEEKIKQGKKSGVGCPEKKTTWKQNLNTEKNKAYLKEQSPKAKEALS